MFLSLLILHSPTHPRSFFLRVHPVPSSVWSQMSAERCGYSRVPFSSVSGIFAFANSFN